MVDRDYEHPDDIEDFNEMLRKKREAEERRADEADDYVDEEE